MFRLTREVRFAINASGGPDAQLAAKPTNSYAGFPSLTGLGHFFTLQPTLAGQVDLTSSYLLNIKQVDSVVRQRGVPHVAAAVRSGRFGGGAGVAAELFTLLRDGWPGVTLASLKFSLSPFLSLSVHSSEYPMPGLVRLSQKFEFSASHRLHNPALSDERNRAIFGKCNNPHGHGHNYELQVTLAGTPDDNGVLVDVPSFERIVAASVIERFDHKNLNTELSEFAGLIPSVENIARVIYGLLKPPLQAQHTRLVAVTVWETPKTWCEYSE
jgi:6-pyruvoyltetrahydropterin/6-carboxytetrahydropterin synthase